MTRTRFWSILVYVACLALALSSPMLAAEKVENDPNVLFAPELFQEMKIRNIGPSRGGRSTAVAGVPSERDTFYMGTTGGGVWKTTDGGERWSAIADETLGAASIGAIAVAESDPNVIFVGTGSACPRGNISPGDGVYRSLDAGETWEHVGLPEAGQIGQIRIHPRNPDLVYVAALGPGYLALYFDQPMTIALTLVAALVTWGCVRGLNRWAILFGRRRVVVTMVIGFAVAALMRVAVTSWAASSAVGLDTTAAQAAMLGATVIGFVIPGLIALWIDRTGVIQTLSPLVVASSLVRLVLVVCGMEAMS